MTIEVTAHGGGKAAGIGGGGLARVLRRLRRERRGNAAVEFAMISPVLLGLLVPIADLGAYVYDAMQLQLAAQAGAEYAARHDWNPAGIMSAMQNASSSLHLSAADATVPQNTDLLPGSCYPSATTCSLASAAFTAPNVQACGCVDPTSGAMTTVTCTNPRQVCTSGLTSGVYYTIGAQVRYHPISGLQYPFVSNNSLMTAWATVRVQ